MGLVIVLLSATVSGYDLLADPVGWLLVLVGLATLPVPGRGALKALAALSLVVSAVVWFPAARDALNVTDLALAWAAGLPELATLVLLTHRLSRVAGSRATSPPAPGCRPPAPCWSWSPCCRPSCSAEGSTRSTPRSGSSAASSCCC